MHFFYVTTPRYVEQRSTNMKPNEYLTANETYIILYQIRNYLTSEFRVPFGNFLFVDTCLCGSLPKGYKGFNNQD